MFIRGYSYVIFNDRIEVQARIYYTPEFSFKMTITYATCEERQSENYYIGTRVDRDRAIYVLRERILVNSVSFHTRSAYVLFLNTYWCRGVIHWRGGTYSHVTNQIPCVFMCCISWLKYYLLCTFCILHFEGK